MMLYLYQLSDNQLMELIAAGPETTVLHDREDYLDCIMTELHNRTKGSDD